MTAADRTFRTERTLPFPPPEVYAAFESPILLATWWGPDHFTNTFETFEFTPGGRWKFVMHAPDGQNYHNDNVFECLKRNSKIVIRHAGAPCFTLTVGLRPVDDGTHLSWEQVFDEAETALAVKRVVVPANEQNIDRLTRALFAHRGAQTAS